MILKHLFPVPKHDSKRVMTFAQSSDWISFRHHTYTKTASAPGGAGVELSEVGPRFELRPFLIKLGTLESTDSETEWALRPYMRTAAKNTIFGGK